MDNPCLMIKKREMKMIDKKLNKLALAEDWNAFSELMILKSQCRIKEKKK